MNGPDAGPIRVLQVIAGLDPIAGGPPASAVATSLALRRQGVIAGFAYVVARSREPATTACVDLLRAAGIDVYRFHVTAGSGRRGTRWGISLELAVWLIRNARRFDVIHVHSAWTFTTAIGLAAARLGGRMAVLSGHESLTDFDRRSSGPLTRVAKRMLRRTYFRLFDLVVMASSLEQRDSGSPPGRPSAIVPHAVSSIEPGLCPKRKSGQLRIGFLGRLHPKKNIDLLLHLIANVGCDAELIVAGDGPGLYADRLRRLAVGLGIADKVTWLGFINADEKRGFFGSIDLLAMPSEYESFGIAAVEAMSAGVPVIVSPTVGVSDVVARDKAGLVVPPTSEDLAAAVRAFVENPDFLDSARARAKGTAETFSLGRHGARMQREYLRLVKNAEPNGARHRRERTKRALGLRIETRDEGLDCSSGRSPSGGQSGRSMIATTVDSDRSETPTKLPVTVLLPVLNEELNLPAALASVSWADEVVVVDSGSTDRTVEIARAAQADVINFEYPGHGPKKKAWALSELDLRNDWTLVLDADERVPVVLRNEIEAAVESGDADGYYVDRELVFMGRRMRAFRPNWNLRLFRRGSGFMEDLGLHSLPETGDNEIHEHITLVGSPGYLRSPLLHDDYRGLTAWLDRHNKYATWEAHLYRKLRNEPIGVGPIGFFRLGAFERKRVLRRIWVRLPLRPVIRFFVWYVLRRGFLDGRAGFVFCVLMSYYEFIIGAKLRELRASESSGDAR